MWTLAVENSDELIYTQTVRAALLLLVFHLNH